MDVKFCKGRDGRPCHTIAIGVGGKRPAKFCRPHYVEEFEAEFITARVLAGLVVDARTAESVAPGEIVTLDPVCTPPLPLVYAGLIEVIAPSQETATAVERPAKASVAKG